MICSDCSKVVKPVVAIDIDGTLGNYHPHFLKFAEMWLGRSKDWDRVYYGQEPFRDWFCQSYNCDITMFRQIKLAYRQGGMKRNMPVFPTAHHFINSLNVLDVELWLTTTRPHERYDRVDPDTVEWLRRQAWQFDGLLYSADKISELASRVDPARVVAVLDDQLDILQDVENVFGSPGGEEIGIKRVTTWNSAWDWPVTALHYDNALEVIARRAFDWREQA